MVLFTRYTLFLNEQRPKLKKKSKDMHFSEMTKILGNQWSGMAQDDKQVNDNFQVTNWINLLSLLNSILFPYALLAQSAKVCCPINVNLYDTWQSTQDILHTDG